MGPEKRFHNQENDEEPSDELEGNESATRASPEREENGKRAGLGRPDTEERSETIARAYHMHSPPARLIRPGFPQYFCRPFNGDVALALESVER